jgi:hypothetical protein
LPSVPEFVVGVVGDIRVRGLERRSEPQVYLPSPQALGVSTFFAPKDLVVKSSNDRGPEGPRYVLLFLWREP